MSHRTVTFVLLGAAGLMQTAVAATRPAPPFSSVDTNHDGAISVQEAMNSGAITRAQFLQADVNENGELSKQEYDSYFGRHQSNRAPSSTEDQGSGNGGAGPGQHDHGSTGGTGDGQSHVPDSGMDRGSSIGTDAGGDSGSD